jgi:hypothetical protein
VSDLGVLVLSCDRYRGLWDLFFSRWQRFWPDCRYPIYLLSNSVDYDRPGVITVKTGEDRDWSTNLLTVLDQIPHSDLLLMIEDAPLSQQVDSKAFDRLYERYLKEGVNYLNMKAAPPANGSLDDEMGEVLPGSLYRTALVPCIWKKDVLKALTVRGETAWHFEILGANRSDQFPNFRSLRRPFFGLLHCVIRGKIDRRAAAVLQVNDELRSLGFPVMSRSEQLSLRLRELRSLVLTRLIPSKLRRSVRSFVYSRIIGSGRVV